MYSASRSLLLLGAIGAVYAQGGTHTYTVPLNNATDNYRLLSVRITNTRLTASWAAYGGWNPNDKPVYADHFGDDLQSRWLYSGREFGGADRNAIYGSARWGSGGGHLVPYYTWVWEALPMIPLEYVPYSFGFWPIYWGKSGYGGEGAINYGASGQRPGGEQRMLYFASRDDISIPLYFVIADKATIGGLSGILSAEFDQGGCRIMSQGPPYVFDPDALGLGGNHTLYEADGFEGHLSNVTIVPEMVLQYYRTSSVALGNVVYNNTFSLHNNSDTTYWGRTPFNTTALSGVNPGIQQSFLDCLNTTIAAAIPIIDPALTAPLHTGLSPGMKAGIGIGASVGGILLVLLVWRVWVATHRGPSVPSRTNYLKHESESDTS